MSARTFARGFLQTTPWTGPVAKSSAGEALLPEQDRQFPGKPRQVCEQAGVHPQGGSVFDGGRKRFGALRAMGAARRDQ